MMTTFHLIYLLMMSNALLLSVACVVLIRFDRRARQMEEFWSSPTGAALSDADRHRDEEQTKAIKRLEEGVSDLQRAVKVTGIRKQRAQPAVERNLPIENAIRMAKLGASIEDLTRSCGLNIGEARLMQKLHGKARVVSGGN
jgi:hypothetical protein